ncbi:unnamed protein product [Heligmosomoides polygyrus]|uniref:Protein MIS12 homolog n=1 Tax=Heligmosomoides polygyrus TaxID=6339 RepID=A0A183FLI3_HELPZ|nr:unnamed protein product [Heligmosomoides polygyrus]
MEFMRFINFRNYSKTDFVSEFFEIFTHDYRERKEAPQCEDHGSSKGSCCSSPSSDVDWKKRFVNASRKLQKAVLVIAEMLQKMREINDRLNEFSKQRQAEFSTTTVALPQFDATDMGLLLGEKEVSLPRCSFIALAREQEAALLFEAEAMLLEYDHLKNGIRG